MINQCKYGCMRIGRRFFRWAVALAFMIAIAWPGLVVDAPVRAANQGDTVEAWIDQVLKGMFKRGQVPEPVPKSTPSPSHAGGVAAHAGRCDGAVPQAEPRSHHRQLWSRRREGPTDYGAAVSESHADR